MSQRVPDIAADDDSAMQELVSALDGRAPVYMLEPRAPFGQVVWVREYLPFVGLSSDLFRELAYQVACMRGGGTA